MAAQSGDLTGWYGFKGSRIEFKSDDIRWYNTSWEVKRYAETLMLEGKGTYQRPNRSAVEYHELNTVFQFQKVTKVETDTDFIQRLSGRWELYKIYSDRGIERPKETQFNTTKDGRYQIFSTGKLLEEGAAYINSRHHRVIFEAQDISWEAYFFGDELRLNNPEMSLQFALKRL